MRELDLSEIEAVTGGGIVVTVPTVPTNPSDWPTGTGPYGGDRETTVPK